MAGGNSKHVPFSFQFFFSAYSFFQDVVDAAARRKLLSVELRKRPKKSKIIEKR